MYNVFARLCLLGLLAYSVTTAAQTGNRRGSYPGAEPAGSLTVSKEFVETPSVSGSEESVRHKVRTYLPHWAKPQIDERGNLLVSFGAGPEHLMFVGHLDEIGYVVRDIEADGTLQVENRGGLYDKYYEARPIIVPTRRGPVSGIIMPRPGDMGESGHEDTYSPPEVRVYLGTGSKNESEELGIRIGDSITVPKRFVPLAKDEAAARSFDDRSGCTAMILALMKVDPAKVNKRITFAWVVEEEVGLSGARAIAERSQADYVFAVDTFVSSDSARENKPLANAPLGNGFAIRALNTSGITPKPIVNRVIEIAARHNIPVQLGTTTAANDGLAFVRPGSTGVSISWPGRYFHSPIEVLARSDLEALRDIIHLLMLEF